jgi:hypothetical protein
MFKKQQDPCKECIVRASCNKECIEKWRYKSKKFNTEDFLIDIFIYGSLSLFVACALIVICDVLNNITNNI